MKSTLYFPNSATYTIPVMNHYYGSWYIFHFTDLCSFHRKCNTLILLYNNLYAPCKYDSLIEQMNSNFYFWRCCYHVGAIRLVSWTHNCTQMGIIDGAMWLVTNHMHFDCNWRIDLRTCDNQNLHWYTSCACN